MAGVFNERLFWGSGTQLGCELKTSASYLTVRWSCLLGSAGR